MNREDLLLKEYSPLIKKVIYKYKEKLKLSKIELEDAYQEGMIALLLAIRNFKGSNEDLSKYIRKSIENHLIDVVNKNTTNGNLSFTLSISLDKVYYEKGSYSVNSELLYNDINSEILKLLTINETKIYELKKDGKKNKEIALILNKNIKTIENSFTNIRKKAKELL